MVSASKGKSRNMTFSLFYWFQVWFVVEFTNHINTVHDIFIYSDVPYKTCLKLATRPLLQWCILDHISNGCFHPHNKDVLDNWGGGSWRTPTLSPEGTVERVASDRLNAGDTCVTCKAFHHFVKSHFILCSNDRNINTTYWTN